MPADFCQQHLPAMRRLQQNGVSFTHAFTPTCMCSPSRATLLTSQYPALHGVTTTASPQPTRALPVDLVNLATVLKKAGYGSIYWQGKWHLGGTPLDYGFAGWDPPDAGNYRIINETLGGGTPNNDGRFVQHTLEFLTQQEQAQSNKPWCLVLSLVNPHDVYVGQYNVESAGYSKQDLSRIRVPLPHNCRESLHTKPRAQQIMSWDRVEHENTMQDYCNFYAHLMTVVDAHIETVLNQLDEQQLTNDTVVVRLADHGEQALSHGLVEKFCNAYDESIRIPFIVSNPRVYTQAHTNDTMTTSLLDLVPTITHLVGVQEEFPEGCFYGKSLVPILNDPAIQEDTRIVHFTYDDIGCPGAPSVIRCLRTRHYKYAVYTTPDGSDADWELYHLAVDSDENVNVAGQDEYASVQLDLDERLQSVMREYKTHPAFDWPPKQTRDSRGGLPTQLHEND